MPPVPSSMFLSSWFVSSVCDFARSRRFFPVCVGPAFLGFAGGLVVAVERFFQSDLGEYEARQGPFGAIFSVWFPGCDSEFGIRL